MIDFTNFFEILINDYWIKNFIIIIYFSNIENFRKLDDIRLESLTMRANVYEISFRYAPRNKWESLTSANGNQMNDWHSLIGARRWRDMFV